MIGLPWFLLAAGIAIVVLGFVLAGLPGGSSMSQRTIDPDMRDDDIVRELKRAERLPISTLVILAGFACILVSIGWRIARAVL